MYAILVGQPRSMYSCYVGFEDRTAVFYYNLGNGGGFEDEHSYAVALNTSAAGPRSRALGSFFRSMVPRLESFFLSRSSVSENARRSLGAPRGAQVDDGSVLERDGGGVRSRGGRRVSDVLPVQVPHGGGVAPRGAV